MSTRTIRTAAATLTLATALAATAAFAETTFPSSLIYEARGKTGRIQGNTRVWSVTLARGKGAWTMRIYGTQVAPNAAQGVAAFAPSCWVSSKDREELLALYARVMDSVRKGGVSFGCVEAPIGDKAGDKGPNIVDLTTNVGSFQMTLNP